MQQGQVIDIPVPVVLASSSATRHGLLKRLAAAFEVVPPHVVEAESGGESPQALALGRAEAKARDVAANRPDALVIGADTVVCCRDEIIGKPADRQDAVSILTKLTRHPHRVLTALFLIAPDGRERSDCVGAAVRMRRMSPDEIEDYVSDPGMLDKAGAYALQPDDPNVEELNGPITAVMGLPLERLRELVEELYPASEGR